MVDSNSRLLDWRALWALSLTPALPLLAYFWVHFPPTEVPGVVHLTGTFQVAEVDADPPLTPERLTEARASSMATLELPGSYSRQGFSGLHPWLIKSFDAPGVLLKGDAFVFLPTLRTATAEIFLNGETIGRHGITETQWQQEQAGAAGLYVPQALLRPGRNVLALHVHYIALGIDGMVDDRLIIGPLEVVRPFYDRWNSYKAAMEHGGTLGLLFLLGVLLFLLRMDRDPERRDVYVACSFLLGSVVLYLTVKTGVGWAWWLGMTAAGAIIPLSVTGIILGTGEFVIAYSLKGRFRKVRIANRFICAGFAVAMVSYGGIAPYRVFTLYMIVVLVLVLGVVVWDAVRGERELSLLVLSAVLVVIGAGLTDVFTDLGLFTAPRLFTFAAANLGVFAAVVAVGEFVRIYKHNDALTHTLSTRNRELADALVEATESARLKSEFLANTSHELRTPLNSIINIPQGLVEQFEEIDALGCEACGELFELEVGEEVDPSTPCPACEAVGKLHPTKTFFNDSDPAETIRYLGSVVTSGKHLLSVVNDILDFSKLDAGHMQLSVEPLDLAELIEELTQSMGPLAEQRGIHLTGDLEGALQLRGDRVKLMQVLVNLVSNALKFSDDDGTVIVRARPAGERLRVEVIDHGIGIDVIDQGLIFESFRQVEGGHTRRYAGTGLGLAITKKLVDLHGGTLGVTSERGKGSTFFFEVPLGADDADGLGPNGTGAAGVAILVVDDDPSAVDTTRLALQPLGLRVEGITRSEHALERLAAHPPDLLILDVMMPRVSGVDILQEVRQHPTLKELPILVSSAYSANEDLVKSLGASFLAKPWRPGEMLSAAAGLLGRARPGEEAP